MKSQAKEAVSLAVEPIQLTPAIANVADQRVVEVLEMAPHLVQTPLPRLGNDEADSLERRGAQPRNRGHRALRRRIGRTAERVLDQGGRGRHPSNQGQVGLGDARLGEILGEPAQGLPIAREEQGTAGAAIQTVHRVHMLTDVVPHRLQRDRTLARPTTMNAHPRRLVEHHQPTVDEQDLERFERTRTALSLHPGDMPSMAATGQVPGGGILRRPMNDPVPPADPAKSLLTTKEPAVTRRISPRRLTLYALLAAAAGFIPVPVADELLPQRILRHMVLFTLRAAQRTYPVRQVAPLFRSLGCLGLLLELLLYLPLKLLLYPIRKLWIVVRAVRGLSRRTAATYLLGHTIARVLEQGWLAEGESPEVLRRQSELLRRAFETTLDRVNPVVFSSSIAAVLTSLRGIGPQAWRAARTLLRRERAAAAAETSDLDPVETTGGEAGKGSEVDAAVDGICRELQSPTVMRFLADFDREFDRVLGELVSTVSPSPAASSDGPR